MSQDQRLAETQKRIRMLWRNGKMLNSGTGQFAPAGVTPGIGTYSGSDIHDHSSDFQGDWRSADSWMRWDLSRVRARSRQLERGNPWCRSFRISLINNVVGSRGFVLDPNILTSTVYGDATTGVKDKDAEIIVENARKQYAKPQNYTSRKRLSEQDCDALLITRLCFDGEIILRKIRDFPNEFGFTTQIINPDYLDHNLNRVLENGNMVKMGVELDKTWKFPVAYWFFKRRPNDFFYNYNEFNQALYYQVPAEEIEHIYLQTEDDDQTRGFPWIFAAAVNLFRLGKADEAAVVNFAIGASKMGFFKKTIPDGFVGDVDQLKEGDSGQIIDEVSPGSWQELPWNVEPVPFDPKYPDEQYPVFSKAMLRSVAACLGSSYMSLTGDAEDANLSNLRGAREDEREWWMYLQEFYVRKWKRPEYDEFIYRSLLSRKIALPFSKRQKFSNPKHTGRRWAFTNPIDDLKAKQLAIQLRITSPTAIIEEQGGNREEVFRQLAEDAKDLEAQGTPLDLGPAKSDPAEEAEADPKSIGKKVVKKADK